MAGELICAISTPPGEGGIAIVRASGENAIGLFEVAFRPARAVEPCSHRMVYGAVIDSMGREIDEVMGVFFKAPASYTREDMFELQCHGGAVCARRVLQRLLELGARAAQPGEFTKRAFLNGRIDLSRAEAVMALIGADSELAARASMRQLRGDVASFVHEVTDRLKDELALIEACTDFPDEVEERDAAAQVLHGIRGARAMLSARLDEKGARIVRDGASIVIAGLPNVGKSSLMNALLKCERAIVTDIPGTTRDVLTERIHIGGMTARLSDTAGQRVTSDPIERIGVARASEAMREADLVLLLLDGSRELTSEDRELLSICEEKTICCVNKCDLPQKLCFEDAISISAKSGEGIELLLEEIAAFLKPAMCEDGIMTLQRHIELAKLCMSALEHAESAIREHMPLDVCAIDLMEALEQLSSITGENATEEVIDRVFASFCVGK